MKHNTISADNPYVHIRRNGQEVALEYQFINAEGRQAPLIVFLHEGMGSINMWRGWPAKVCLQLQCRGLVYSRYGYGQSTPRQAHERRTINYLHEEAADELPAVLEALGLGNEQLVLYGHSDGGSIALIYAALFPTRVQAIAVAAPHIFVEDVTLRGLRAARKVYEAKGLDARLGRYHRDPETVFLSWNDTWLTDEFKHWNIEALLPRIRCPVLAIQGQDDEFGSLAQITDIQRHTPQTRLCVIPECGHSPHRDASDIVIRELGKFINDLSTDTQ